MEFLLIEVLWLLKTTPSPSGSGELETSPLLNPSGLRCSTPLHSHLGSVNITDGKVKYGSKLKIEKIFIGIIHII